MSMARPARSSGAVVVTLLLTVLLLLLPAPASSQLPALVGGILRTPAARKIGATVAREVIKAGGEALVKQWFANASASANVKRLGSTAAADAAYIVYSVSIGPAPQQTFYGVVDILHDFLWVSCPPEPPFQSIPCESQTCLGFLNTTAAANCNRSATGGGDCFYTAYGPPNTTGFLAAETLTVGAQNIAASNVVFGCSRETTLAGGNYGNFGFSQGRQSILYQLRISRFSYFLAPVYSDTPFYGSAVLVGAQAVPQTTRSRSTTLTVSKAYPGLYFVQLTGIQVDGVWVPGIPAGAFDLAADGRSGGVVLSTTIFVTYIEKNAYYALRQELARKIGSVQVQSSDGFDLCYNTQSVAQLTFPKITLVFAGADSPAMDLTTVHYFFKDNATGLQCLTILPTPDDTPLGSIIGSMLQAGTNMIYDTDAGQLTFESSVALEATVPSQLVITSLLLVWVLLF